MAKLKKKEAEVDNLNVQVVGELKMQLKQEKQKLEKVGKFLVTKNMWTLDYIGVGECSIANSVSAQNYNYFKNNMETPHCVITRNVGEGQRGEPEHKDEEA